MKTITVKAAKQYQVHIGKGLHKRIGEYVVTLGKKEKAAIISDTNVWPLYGATILESLQKADIETCYFVLEAGEESKNGHNYLSIMNFLAENHITRSDVLIALGGGVVGDITGFAAATYLRGISYIQVPTTLLAMVDSSIGGKTAIDLPAGKNLAGSFYQPSLVLCDIAALDTLPDDVFRDGCAEVIKYSILYDYKLFEHLQNNGINFNRESVISRCIELKRDVVAKDEFDKGERQKLNLGHTIGHGIEANSQFTVSHGKAVAVGMAIVSKASAQMGICNEDIFCSILDLLNRFDLPTCTDITAEQLYRSALSDKKRTGQTVNLIVPVSIGNCCIYPTPVEQLLSFIEAGL